MKDHCHYKGKYRVDVQSIYKLKHSTPKETSVAFHNGSNYDYNFVIKEPRKEFEGEFHCLEENTEENKAFSVPVTEVKRIYKNGKEPTKTISYRLQFINSANK